MNGDLLLILDHIERERGIERDVLLEAVESALASAAKKGPGALAGEVSVVIDRQTGEISVFAERRVVVEIEDPNTEISLAEAQQYDPDAEEGDVVSEEVTPDEFGRIAAQTAKQVIIQKIREAERDIVYHEFEGREGDIVNGVVTRFEQGNVIVDIGRTEAILPYRERTAREEFHRGERVRAYILEVRRSESGPQVILSRTHPGLVDRLFAMEVPEISDGIVEIRAVAREMGERTKIAVHSEAESVDPVGACVGVKGGRVKAIVRELRGEKIDIIRWSPDAAVFITNALSPARVERVRAWSDLRRAEVVVADDQLSLAIGKRGQNVRLAAKLTGWHIDIRSQSEARAVSELAMRIDLTSLPGVGEKLADAMRESGITSWRDILDRGMDGLLAVEGIGGKTAERVLDAVRNAVGEEEEAAAKPAARGKEAPAAAAKAPAEEPPEEVPEEPPAAEVEPPSDTGEAEAAEVEPPSTPETAEEPEVEVEEPRPES